jgi:SAM-dependent methyltransferase
MDRRSKLLNGLDLPIMSGVEIGALASPLVKKADGDVVYVDYADTDSLRQKYSTDEGVSTENIVDVDFIWGDKTLKESIGADKKFDYVIASHVVEHVPDLIGWLCELRDVLKPDGQIRLAIPDKRFCFDILRKETELLDVVSANLLKARIPQPRSILDFVSNYVDVNAKAVWDQNVDLGSLRPKNCIKDALPLVAQSLRGEYIDVHCWVFTPNSFVKLFEHASMQGLMRFECVDFIDTQYGEFEFFVTLRPAGSCADANAIAESWRRVERDMLARTTHALA